jgi:hypothetical protein
MSKLSRKLVFAIIALITSFGLTAGTATAVTPNKGGGNSTPIFTYDDFGGTTQWEVLLTTPVKFCESTGIYNRNCAKSAEAKLYSVAKTVLGNEPTIEQIQTGRVHLFLGGTLQGYAENLMKYNPMIPEIPVEYFASYVGYNALCNESFFCMFDSIELDQIGDDLFYEYDGLTRAGVAVKFAEIADFLGTMKNARTFHFELAQAGIDWGTRTFISYEDPFDPCSPENLPDNEIYCGPPLAPEQM